MRWCADDVNGPGSQTDVSTGQADRSGRQADALDGSNKAEMAGMSHGDGARTYLGTRDTKHGVKVTDGIGSHADTSSGIGDVPRVGMAVNRSANVPENVRIPQEQAKLPDSPMEAAKQHSDDANGFRN